MPAILLVPFGPRGHLEHLLALGAALRRDGHRVAVFAEAAHVAAVDRAGLATVLPVRWGTGGAVPARVLAGGAGPTLRYLFFGCVLDMTRDVTDAAAATGADLIVSDVMMPGGGLAAERTGRPWVSVACVPVPDVGPYPRYLDPHLRDCFDAGPTLAELGLPGGDAPAEAAGRTDAAPRPETTNRSVRRPGLLGRLSPYLHLIPTTPEFAGYPSLPERVALVGPFTEEPPDPARRRPGQRPTVAVTTSTAPRAALGGRAPVRERYLRTAVAALAGLDADVVLTVPADHDATSLGALPDNVSVAGDVPHGALFDRCDVVVSQAGWGTVSRALNRGLPQVLAPLCNDQPYTADRCAALGLGIALDPVTVTPQALREAVRTVCAEPSYARTAGRFAAGLRATAPLTTSVSMIDDLLSTEG